MKKARNLELFQELIEMFRYITEFNFTFIPADNKYAMLRTPDAKSKETDFCKIIQTDPEGLKQCCDENRLITIMNKMKKPLIETCHAGLIDVFIPVIIDSEFIGYFCLGKFLFNPPTDGGFKEILEKTNTLGIDSGQLRKAYFKTRVLNKDYIDLLTRIFIPIATKMVSMELDIWEEKKKVEKLNYLLFKKHFSDEIIGRSEKMRAIFTYLGKINKSDGCVFICGESGTGKELIAKYIHVNSSRKEKPFLAVNCASLSDQILESELFGHVKGAFSGAIQGRLGILETVNGGTLCLDEIGETSLAFQKKLLRVIEEKEIRPVGSDKIKKIDIRFVASTNKDPKKLIREGKFREDLFYRLTVFNIVIPSLRERPEDIPVLTKHFCTKQTDKYGAKELSFTRKAIEALMNYQWPGNVRELRNFVEKLYFLAEGEVTASMVKSYLETDVGHQAGRSELFFDDYESAFENFERKFLFHKLTQNSWNVSKTARQLGRTREWLSRKVSTLELKKENPTTGP